MLNYTSFTHSRSNSIQRLFLLLSLVFVTTISSAQRAVIPLNNDWLFRFSHEVHKESGHKVTLPHTWNAVDALSGKPDYKRGIGNYSRSLFVPASWQGRRIFIRFEGANTTTDLFLNGKHIGEHRGGYGAFIFELTDKLIYGAKNQLLVRVNNAEQLDVMPLVGDFNFYGGIYRNVALLLTNDVCISPLDYASPGIYLRQTKVDAQQADVKADVMLDNPTDKTQQVEVAVEVFSGDKSIIKQQKSIRLEAQAMVEKHTIPFTIHRPHLWNGTQDPFIYKVKVSLWQGKTLLDEVEQPLGLRYYKVDPARGFFLNGRHLQLHGVCRHQDRAVVGNALAPEDIREDVKLMREMGVNAVRLAHYPHSSYTYDQMDRAGIVTWAEIPFVGPGGYADKGFVDSERFRANGKAQLCELIRQHFNHPSICFWGLFNELKYEGDNPLDYIRELNTLAHAEDSTRLTTCASNQMGEMNFITDVMAWNRYDGWYGSTPSTLATFLDEMHAKYPQLCIALSEYGAGASVRQQQDSLIQPQPNSWWHPENWQTFYHIRNWDIISHRPFLWGSFVWNMFDFGAAHRTEGDRPGINDKGLVTHDRKTKKDAYYFYKANWNPEPMVYIAGKRCTERKKGDIDLWVFSNCKSVTLTINGKPLPALTPNDISLCTFHVTLQPGLNRIVAKGMKAGKLVKDEWEVETESFH